MSSKKPELVAEKVLFWLEKTSGGGGGKFKDVTFSALRVSLEVSFCCFRASVKLWLTRTQSIVK